MLIRYLPPESATVTALRNTQPDGMRGGDPAEGRWSQAEMLQAATVDALQHLAWLYTCAHTPAKAPKPPKPDPIPRPGAKAAGKQRRLSDGAYERLFNHINGLPGGPQLQLIKGGKPDG